MEPLESRTPLQDPLQLVLLDLEQVQFERLPLAPVTQAGRVFGSPGNKRVENAVRQHARLQHRVDRVPREVVRAGDEGVPTREGAGQAERAEARVGGVDEVLERREVVEDPGLVRTELRVRQAQNA